ncbi:hypothetical protein B5X24_HaOG210196 [Helicoverpa armigera]|uniref:Uncharacterized protein n=1 Tax=Helicoverpa armigera TaxID=29058 RepID=A0A2W1BDJ3_HELAM|nr:hypothetical protein B5X24_HaOG210196 [Helicoverpa armigera]
MVCETECDKCSAHLGKPSHVLTDSLNILAKLILKLLKIVQAPIKVVQAALNKATFSELSRPAGDSITHKPRPLSPVTK